MSAQVLAKFRNIQYPCFLDAPEAVEGTETFPGLRREIRLEDVWFRYPNAEEDALRGLSLTIRKGEKIALIGENGSGKTTLAKIIFGLYPPTRGRVTFDGLPPEAFTHESFYRDISHRVGLCKLADRIVVLKHGALAETGTHAQLLGQAGEYARLYGEQRKWYA
jgi:ABC-type bacteriocin/lantibiotic exporter with double-glycine peptidase domain